MKSMAKRQVTTLQYAGVALEVYLIAGARSLWVAHTNEQDGHIGPSALRAVKGWFEMNEVPHPNRKIKERK